MQLLYQFVLLGHLCWATDYHTGELKEECGNIYEYEKSKHITLQSCIDRAEYLGTKIMLNLKNKGSYVTEMTINCLPKGLSITHQIIWQ